MTHENPSDGLLKLTFSDALAESMDRRLGVPRATELIEYLSEMLVRFLHLDALYGVQDVHGRRITSVAEMLAEGDVRLNANSFDRERAVHRHIGDFLLFWSGMFPEVKTPSPADALIDPVRQGRHSYYVVSTFDHGRYADEAPIFRRLSQEFEACQTGIALARTHLRGTV